MESLEVERSALDGRYGDEAIRDAVLRELREDAATTALVLDVQVHKGVVRIRGLVPDLVDAENAEEVASRLPGVVEVIDETKVEGM
jgi:osmotically-inducible protein OsmY